MKAEYINPFLVATAHVLKQLTGLEPVRGRTFIRGNPAPSHEIGIFIGVTGSQVGQAIYSMNLETAYRICRKLLPGIDEASLKNEYRDMMGEVGNMITGNAMQIFERTRVGIDLSVPMVADLRKDQPRMEDRPSLSLNLYTPMGLLEVNIGMQDS